MSWAERVSRTAEDVRAALHRGSRSLHIVAPTGSGKTRLGLMIANIALEYATAPKSIPILWISPNRELVYHVWKELIDHRVMCPSDLIPVTRQSGHAPSCQVMVIDEAHHAGAVTYWERMHRARPEIVIGLTATPWRNDRRILPFETEIVVADLNAMIQVGRLAPFRLVETPLRDPADYVQAYLAFRNTWGPSIIYQPTVESALCVVERLRGENVRVGLVVGSSRRDELLPMFRRQEIEVLVSVFVLTEGFDEPAIASVFLRKSNTLTTLQMLGRGLRSAPNKVACAIVDQATRREIVKHARPQSIHLLEDLIIATRA